MLSKISDLLECLGLIGAAVAIGCLAGIWWGVLAGSFFAVGYGYLLDDTSAPSGDG